MRRYAFIFGAIAFALLLGVSFALAFVPPPSIDPNDSSPPPPPPEEATEACTSTPGGVCRAELSTGHYEHIYKGWKCGYCGLVAANMTYTGSLPRSSSATSCKVTILWTYGNCCYDPYYYGIAFREPPPDTDTLKRDITLPRPFRRMSDV